MSYKCVVCKTEKTDSPFAIAEGKKVCSEYCKEYLIENLGKLNESQEDIIEQTQLLD